MGSTQGEVERSRSACLVARETAEQAGRRRGVREGAVSGSLDSLLDPHALLRPVRDEAGAIADFVCAEANRAALEYLELARDSLLGASVLQIFPERAATEMLPLLALTMETGQPLVLDDYRYPSEVFACERRYDVRVVRVADGLSCTWCDVTQRHEIEDCLRRRVGELDFIHRISQLLAVRSDLPSALQAAGREIDDLFGARSSRVLVLVEGADAKDTGALETASAAGAAATACEAFVVERALATRRPALVESCERSGRRLLGVPLVSRARLLGVLTIVREAEEPTFTQHEVTVAESVADALAAAVENERLHQRAAREAAAGERQRLARDLHDSVTQTLYSANLIAEVLPEMAALDAAEGLEGLGKLRRLNRMALCEMRTLLYELRPETLASASLEVMLERLGDALTGHEGTTVDIAVDEEVEPPTEVKLAVYRVAQEALTNISKHAQAGSVAVVVVSDGDGARLSVRDDGRGFDPGGVQPGSMGLRIMHERAQEIGASLEVHSPCKGGGTEVRLIWRRDTTDAAAR